MKLKLACLFSLMSVCLPMWGQTYQFIPEVTPIDEQAGKFILQVDLTPNTINEIDTMVGFSGGTSLTGFAQLAGYVVLFTDNNISDAIIKVGGNPGNAQPDNSVQVVAGETYGIIFEIDVPSKTYTAKVRMPDDSIVVLAENYGFRQQASTIKSFVYLPYVVKEYAGVAAMSNLAVMGSWGGYPVLPSGDSDTGSFLGWINVLGTPWIWNYNLAKYLYVDEVFVTESGSWGYFPL